MDWKIEYSIGIPEIDEQHKQLLECINRLETAADDHQRKLAVYYVMEELSDYVRVHFAVEEIVMRLFDFPGLAAHAKEHREFAASLKLLKATELNHTTHGKTDELLSEWLIHHVMGGDKRYAAFLEQGGATLLRN